VLLQKDMGDSPDRAVDNTPDTAVDSSRWSSRDLVPPPQLAAGSGEEEGGGSRKDTGESQAGSCSSRTTSSSCRYCSLARFHCRLRWCSPPSPSLLCLCSSPRLFLLLPLKFQIKTRLLLVICTFFEKSGTFKKIFFYLRFLNICSKFDTFSRVFNPIHYFIPDPALNPTLN
jgi:hypothetical protein